MEKQLSLASKQKFLTTLLSIPFQPSYIRSFNQTLLFSLALILNYYLTSENCVMIPNGILLFTFIEFLKIFGSLNSLSQNDVKFVQEVYNKISSENRKFTLEINKNSYVLKIMSKNDTEKHDYTFEINKLQNIPSYLFELLNNIYLIDCAEAIVRKLLDKINDSKINYSGVRHPYSKVVAQVNYGHELFIDSNIKIEFSFTSKLKKETCGMSNIWLAESLLTIKYFYKDLYLGKIELINNAIISDLIEILNFRKTLIRQLIATQIKFGNQEEPSSKLFT